MKSGPGPKKRLKSTINRLRAGASLDAPSNHTATGTDSGPTPVYPGYLDTDSGQSDNATQAEDNAYIRSRTPNIHPKDTVHVSKQTADGSSYKTVVKRGSTTHKLATEMGGLPTAMQRSRAQFLTESDDPSAAKNYSTPGARSYAVTKKRKKKK